MAEQHVIEQLAIDFGRLYPEWVNWHDVKASSTTGPIQHRHNRWVYQDGTTVSEVVAEQAIRKGPMIEPNTMAIILWNLTTYSSRFDMSSSGCFFEYDAGWGMWYRGKGNSRAEAMLRAFISRREKSDGG